jgi:hypothetical protein
LATPTQTFNSFHNAEFFKNFVDINQQHGEPPTMNNEIPYVLLVNNQGKGFTLDRSYKLQHHTLNRLRGKVARLKEVAKKSEAWSPTGKNQMPDWCRKRNSYLCPLSKQWKDRYYIKGFIAYWIEPDQANKVLEEKPPVGVTYNFEKWGNLVNELREEKRTFIKEVRKQWKRDIGKNVFISDTAFVRFYLVDMDGQLDCAQINDDWSGIEKLTFKNARDCVEEIVERMKEQKMFGHYSIWLCGSCAVSETMVEMYEGNQQPTPEEWEIAHFAEINMKKDY